MKILIALLCLGMALASHHLIEDRGYLTNIARMEPQPIQDSAFRSGREYHFFYNAQLTTGIPGSSKQHSANRLQCLVTVQFKTPTEVLMRLQHVRIGKLNRDIPNPRKIMPFDAFEDIQIEAHLKQKLERTVKFTYTAGLVHNVKFDHQEDPWSANIKRGVLNLLQVNLQQQRRMETPDEIRLTNSPRFIRAGDDDKTTFYRVMEKSLEGECETLYTIQQEPTDRRSNKPVLNVTKSINFEKCNQRPQVKYNFRFADDCPTCDPKYEQDEKFMKSSTVAKFNITGDKQSFLIEGARVDSEYVFTPANVEANTIVTYVNLTLILIKSGPSQPLPEPQNPVDSDSDMMFTLDWEKAFEKFHRTGDNHVHQKLHESQRGLNKVELAKKFVQKLGNHQKEQLDDDVLLQFIRLVQLMRMCKEDELEQITNGQSWTSESQSKLKNIIPQALGSCGSKLCVKLLAEKIRQGQVSTLRGAFALKGLLHNRVVSQEIITEVTQLCDSQKARDSELLKRSCWLTAGSLINALCTPNEDQLALETKESTEKLCPRELKEKYVKLLFNKFRSATKWQDKVLMLQTVQNAGLELSILDLEKIILEKDGQYPINQRFESIFALRQMKDSVPKKIQRILMPILMNRREYPTIRQAAAHVLLLTKPERPILDQLAHNLISEPSTQFASFVYTQMLAYANSTNPCEEKLSTDMKLALRHAKKINGGFYSKMSQWSLHSEKQKLGLDLNMDVIFSNVSSIPRHMGINLHANAMGFWLKDLASLEMYKEGVEQYVQRFMSNNWPSDMQKFGRMFRSPINEPAQQHSTSEEDEEISPRSGAMNNGRFRSGHNHGYYNMSNDASMMMTKRMNFRQRDYRQEYQNEPKAYLTATYKGQAIGFFPMSTDAIQELVQDASTNMRQWREKLSQGFLMDYTTLAELHDMHYKIPTTIGMPLTVTIKAPVAWSLKGKVQITSPNSPGSVKIQAQLKPNAVMSLLCKVEAWSPIVNTGIKIKSKVKLFAPVDARLEVDLNTTPINVKMAIKPPSQKRDLVVLESRPVTFTQDWQRYVRSVDDGVDEKTIMGEEQNRVSTFNKCIGRQTLGVEICARGQVHKTPIQSMTGTPISVFNGPNKIVVTCEPGQDVPQEIEVQLSGEIKPLNGNEKKQRRMPSAHYQQYWNEDEDDTIPQLRRTEGGENYFRPRREAIRQPRMSANQRFMDFYTNYEVKKGFKTELKVDMQAGHNRRMKLDVQHIFDTKQRYGQVQMKLQRQRPDQWEACFDAELMYPESPEYSQDVKDKKILASAELKWGQTCSSQNYVRLTTLAERSQQQKEWEKRHSQYSIYRQDRCQNKHWCSPLNQEEFVEKIGHMLKYRVDIDYQNVPVSVQNVTNKLYRALKHYTFWNADVDQYVQNQPNKIKAEFVLDAQSKQRLNVTVQTPKETVNIEDLPLSQPLGVVNQKQSVFEQVQDYLEDDAEDQGTCLVSGKQGWQPNRAQIKTFDGSKFSAPFTSCWVVLAKDCGSIQSPKFIVLAKKSSHDQAGGKDVKILTRHDLIELKKDGDDVKCIVNGQEKNLDNDEQQFGDVMVEKYGSIVHVHLIKSGVEVDFDGFAVKIDLSHVYQGQQCGLCGHFDKERADEFRNPDFTEEQDLRQYYMNYLIRDQQCQPPQLDAVCESAECDLADRSSSSSSSSSQSQENSGSNESSEAPEAKTKVIEEADQICFSTVPFAQCDEDSYPSGTKQPQQIRYVCIDQDDESAEQFERLARSGHRHEIAALKNRNPSFTRTEIIPEKCKKYKN